MTTLKGPTVSSTPRSGILHRITQASSGSPEGLTSVVPPMVNLVG